MNNFDKKRKQKAEHHTFGKSMLTTEMDYVKEMKFFLCFQSK